MPTYGYRCPACATEFEVWQRMTDPAGADCPSCGAPSRRLFFPAGIVFKGGGFYKTDSRGAESASTASATAGNAAPDKQAGAGEGRKAGTGDAAAAPAAASAPASSPSTSGPASAPSPPAASPGPSPPGKSA